MNHEIISLLSTLGLRDEIVQINKMMKLIKFAEAKKNANLSKYTIYLYRQSRKERNTSTIHIAMARAVIVDSKKIILGHKERRLQIKDDYKTNHFIVV